MQATDSNIANRKSEQRLALGRFIIRLCISITLTIGLLAAGECAAYFNLRARAPDRFNPFHPIAVSSYYKGAEWFPDYVRDQIGSDKFQYESYLIWRGAPYNGRTIFVDADGVRRTFYSHCDNEEFTVWMFGGSGLWGDKTPDWDTIPSLIAQRYEKSGRRVCVKNFGERGWASTQEIVDLLLELKRSKKKPDVVVFYDGSIDAQLPLEVPVKPLQVDVHWAFGKFKRQFESWRAANQAGFGYLRNTYTYLALQRIAEKLTLAHGDSDGQQFSVNEINTMAAAAFENYLKNIEILAALSQQYGFQFACFWEPMIGATRKPLSAVEQSIRREQHQFYPAPEAMEIATSELFRTFGKPHLVYLGDLFNDNHDTLFLDPTHVGPEGNRMISDRIFQTIQHLER